MLHSQFMRECDKLRVIDIDPLKLYLHSVRVNQILTERTEF